MHHLQRMGDYGIMKQVGSIIHMETEVFKIQWR